MDNVFRWVMDLKANLLKAKSPAYLVWIAAPVTVAFGRVLYTGHPSNRLPFGGIGYA